MDVPSRHEEAMPRVVLMPCYVGAGGFPTERDSLELLSHYTNFCQGQISQTTRRHLQCDTRACGV